MKTKYHKPEKVHQFNKKANGKNDTGVPTLYKPEYCQMIVDYFANSPKTQRIVKSVSTGKNDFEKIEYETVACELPTISKWARLIGVTHRTVDNWAKEHKDFFLALEESKVIYKEFLNDNGLAGYYNPLYTKFVAINTTDMKDKTETDLKMPEGIAINITKTYIKPDERV